MFIKSKKGYYFWEEFARIDGIVHGFSTRKFGDMNKKNPRSSFNFNLFCKSIEVNKNAVIRMEQVHSNNVVSVSNNDSDKVISKTDGLVSEESVFLVGTFADCAPVMFFDKKKKIVGIVHAGWKGVYKEIVKNMVSKIIGYNHRHSGKPRLSRGAPRISNGSERFWTSQNDEGETVYQKGSNVEDIIIGIGPSIRYCCYNIDKERINKFLQKFGKWKDKIIKKRSDKIFLDLQTLIRLQLLELGVLGKNIYDCGICTSDTVSDFFSFRKENKDGVFKTFAGIIGRI